MPKFRNNENAMQKLIEIISSKTGIPKTEMYGVYASKENLFAVEKSEQLAKNIEDAFNISKQIKADYNLPPVTKELARVVIYMIDTSGTPEATKHNVELLKKASTIEGSAQIKRQLTEEMLNLNLNNYYTNHKDVDSFFDDIDDKYLTAAKAFACKDFMELKPNNELFDKMKGNITTLQGLGVYGNLIDYYKSPLGMIIPQKYLKDKEICEKIMDCIPDVMEAFPGMDVNEVISGLTSMAPAGQTVVQYNKYNDFFKKNKVDFSKGVFKGGYFTLDGVETPDNDNISKNLDNETNTVKFEKYTDEELIQQENNLKEIINQDFEIQANGKEKFKKPLEDTTKFRNVYEHMDKGLVEVIGSFTKSFEDTHHKFSKDSKQFKDMEQSIKDFMESYQNYTSKLYDDSLVKKDGDNLLNSFNALKENLDAYVAYKTEDEKRFHWTNRGRDRLILANGLKKIVDNFGNTPELKEFNEEKQKELNGEIEHPEDADFLKNLSDDVNKSNVVGKSEQVQQNMNKVITNEMKND